MHMTPNKILNEQWLVNAIPQWNHIQSSIEHMAIERTYLKMELYQNDCRRGMVHPTLGNFDSLIFQCRCHLWAKAKTSQGRNT